LDANWNYLGLPPVNSIAIAARKQHVLSLGGVIYRDFDGVDWLTKEHLPCGSKLARQGKYLSHFRCKYLIVAIIDHHRCWDMQNVTDYAG